MKCYQEQMVGGMIRRGYERDFAERRFDQIKGFGEYGFPESHAQAFGWLACVSSWLKCHFPAAFTYALLNSQPMGFYAPAQLVSDARAHGLMCSQSMWEPACGIAVWKAQCACGLLSARSMDFAQAGPRRWLRRARLHPFPGLRIWRGGRSFRQRRWACSPRRAVLR